jgi:cysteate synthase
VAKVRLTCVGCGTPYDPPRLHCDRCDGLLRSTYEVSAFRPGNARGLFSFLDWLPTSQVADLPIGTAVYRSEGLAKRLELPNLAIAFSGYAPDLGAANPTGTFKDFEAAVTVLYCREHGIEWLILASAGNTARAFAYAAVRLDFPIVLVVPEKALENLWIPCRPTDAVRLVVLDGCDDYTAAIRVSARIAQILDIPSEGGARNVARRDGMSTALLEYAKTLGGMPDHYVQAVGSGTGAIATWEAAQRLRNAGIGDHLPVLHLSQNAPFAPIHDAWMLGRPIRPDIDVEGQLDRIAQIDALVLANREPPYAVPGGVRDALESTGGRTYAVDNAHARAAGKLFEETEGVPIGPAAAVGTASLVEGVRRGWIEPDDAIMLHITGSDELLRREVKLHRLPETWRISPDGVTEPAVRAARDRLAP